MSRHGWRAHGWFYPGVWLARRTQWHWLWWIFDWRINRRMRKFFDDPDVRRRMDEYSDDAP